ncbi:ABC transporter permease [Deinococcus sp.]|uniref:ABC transporter permease n=1 Tax=Deinococcus sp. TaxID=47478 RepID=UPI003CC62102
MPASLRPWLLILPALLLIGLFFLAPVVALLLESFKVNGVWGLGQFVRFFQDDLNREVYVRTLRIAAVATVVSAAVCYPAAQAVVRLPGRHKGLMTAVIILPLMVNPVARTYAWLVLLGRTGLVNSLLVGLHLSPEPLRLLYTEGAVFIGLLQLMMPLMLTSLVSALENLPADVTAAARSLGASGWQVFWRVTLPLTREGLVIGGTLVFTGCVTAYVTASLLGGPRVLLLETLLYQKVNVGSDYVGASVIAVILIATTLLANQALRLAGRLRGQA